MTTIDRSLEAPVAVPLDSRFLEPDVETAPRAEIEALQEARILELVPYAWENSAFYRELWSKAGISPSDIKSLRDFTDKDPDVREGRHPGLP